MLDPLRDCSESVSEVVGERYTTLGQLESVDGGPVEESDLVVTYSYFGGGKGRWVARADVDNDIGEGRAGDLYVNDRIRVRDVPEAVWTYELGGYPVVKKWLGYRDAKRTAGRALRLDEVAHLRDIIRRIAALVCLRPQLDVAYSRAAADAFEASNLLDQPWP